MIMCVIKCIKVRFLVIYYFSLQAISFRRHSNTNKNSQRYILSYPMTAGKIYKHKINKMRQINILGWRYV